MFKNAASKIAHNSTLPALGGNQDLRPLQDLITAEKAVLISLQKLSVDYSKASEALRTWGLSEGEDLGDILGASTTLLNHFSSALSQYAAHGHAMRDQLKAIRTREEALEDLKRRRRAVLRKADDAEKKLSKMSPEHKNLGMQTETLNRLRDEIRTMDSDIMMEEAALGDFKRSATRMWMGIKFGGLLECCEKGTIAGEFGKLLISEISEELSQPGLPRSLYYGHGKTESLVAEAHRCINEVTLSTVASVGFRDRRQYDEKLPGLPQDNLSMVGASQQGGYRTGGEGYALSWSPSEGKPQPPPPEIQEDSPSYPSNPARPYGNGHFNDPSDSPSTSTGATFANQLYSPQPQQQLSQGPGASFSSQTMPLGRQGAPANEENVDDFGVNSRSSGPLDTFNTAGGRFATFPVKARPPGAAPGYTLEDPPSLGSRHPVDNSFSASIAEALDEKAGPIGGTQNRSASPPWSGRLGSESSNYSEGTARATEGTHNHHGGGVPWGGRFDNASTSIGAGSVTSPPFSSGPPPPPPGAALPDPWANATREGSINAASHSRQPSQLSENDALLAYMTATEVDDDRTEESPNQPISHMPPSGTKLSISAAEDEQQRISRHVRFGEVEDVNEEIEKRASLEKDRHGQVAGSGRGSNDTDRVFVEDLSKAKPAVHRVAPPAFDSEEDEKALNAAAAREISLELEALNGSPTMASDMSRFQSDITSDRGRVPPYPTAASRENSPLVPPLAPFAKRSVSPHPYADLNTPPPAPYSPPQYSPTQSYAQSHQATSPYGHSPPNVSPAQAYAQSYSSTHSNSQAQTPEGHVPTTAGGVPPRFQALNQSIDSPIPPRFQGARSHSPGSPSNSVPPRFQSGNTTQAPPPAISLPEQQEISSLRVETPYRTPLEYPRSIGSASPFAKSNTSLNSPSPIMPGAGARTISAAAFKRPQPRKASNDTLGTSGSADMFGKKSLPSSPYPLRENPATAYSAAGSPLPPPPIGTGQRDSVANSEDDYDYISAYVNTSNPGSPQRKEFGTSIPVHGQGAGAAATGPRAGYGDGRFATDLESDLR
ncbi:hypothetical protein B0H34DRAFT_803134 [Crassisporium funariophilum]|nr:hypothetical protein B0H34DRAFT_803134 [Crassisporium funariophilum]